MGGRKKKFQKNFRGQLAGRAKMLPSVRNGPAPLRVMRETKGSLRKKKKLGLNKIQKKKRKGGEMKKRKKAARERLLSFSYRRRTL